MIDPNAITTIRVDQLSDAPFSLTDNLPHEVSQVLKRGTVQNLVDLIATVLDASGGVGYLPISVVDGQQLPDVPTDASFFLCGKGTFLNVNGYPDIVCTKGLNAIMSLSDHWEIAVEIPITVDPENIGIAQTVNSGVLDSAPSQDAVFKALNQYVNAVGSFHYADLATQTTPQAIAANVDEKLLNDALGAYTNVSNAPYGISSVYNEVTNQLDFTQLSVGDLINFRIDLFIETSGTDQLFKFYIKFGIGSASEFTLNVSQGQVKTNSMFRVSEDVCFDIGSADIKDYPAEIWISTNKAADITINGWYIEIVRKNVNIVDLPTSVRQDVDFGSTSSNAIDSINNALPNIYIQDQNLGQIKIQGTFTGTYHEYLFTGIKGYYGNGALQAVGNDFIEVGINSEDYIPLSGTTVGNPVTGDIEFIGDGEITSLIAKKSETQITNLTFDTDENSIYLKTIAPLLEAMLTLSSSEAVLIQIDTFNIEYNSLRVNEFGVEINSTKSNPRGIISQQDYSANITDLDYPQKIYVDSRFLEVADYASLLLLPTPIVLKTVKVLNDENKGITNTIYQLWPDGTRMWIASTEDI